MNQESTNVNYSLALKNYSQNGRGRSRREFCEDEGYDYNKFMQYARKGRRNSASSKMRTRSSRNRHSFLSSKGDDLTGLLPCNLTT